jgi:hypothetical protein
MTHWAALMPAFKHKQAYVARKESIPQSWDRYSVGERPRARQPFQAEPAQEDSSSNSLCSTFCSLHGLLHLIWSWENQKQDSD